MTFFSEFFLQKPKPYGSKGLYHEIFENRIPFGRDIRILNISAYARLAMKSIPHMLSQRLNSFRSVCDGIRSKYAQHKFTCKNCSHFTAGWACAKIRSSYAQCAMKSFPHMLSMRLLKFSKITQKSPIKMQISSIRNWNVEKPFRKASNRT